MSLGTGELSPSVPRRMSFAEVYSIQGSSHQEILCLHVDAAVS